MPQRVKNPANRLLGAIGAHLINSGHKYEDALKHAMGPSNHENRIQLEQIFSALQGCQVRLSIDEKNGLTEWFRQSMDA